MDAFLYPILLALYDFFIQLNDKLNLENDGLVNFTRYLAEFWNLTASNTDMERAKAMKTELGKLFKTTKEME